jgi:hypothetical protein
LVGSHQISLASHPFSTKLVFRYIFIGTVFETIAFFLDISIIFRYLDIRKRGVGGLVPLELLLGVETGRLLAGVCGNPSVQPGPLGGPPCPGGPAAACLHSDPSHSGLEGAASRARRGQEGRSRALLVPGHAEVRCGA